MITHSPTAPLGSVTKLPFYDKQDFPSSSAILCRNGAPLISFAFSLWRRSIPFYVLGRSIPVAVLRLVEEHSNSNWMETQPRLEGAKILEVARAERKGRLALAANLTDRFDCALHFVRESTSERDLKENLKKFFAPPDFECITLTTIHKSKGLEWPKVFFLDSILIPSPFARQDWQITQEKNLRYVAITRAKIDLVYISSNKWKINGTGKGKE